MAHQSPARDEGIEGFFRHSDTWKALTTLLRIGAYQTGAYTITAKNSETGELTLLNADWQAASPQELVVIHRWATKRALELACDIGALLQVHDDASRSAPTSTPTLRCDGSASRSWVTGHLDFWVALTVLADHIAPLIADYNSEET